MSGCAIRTDALITFPQITPYSHMATAIFLLMLAEHR